MALGCSRSVVGLLVSTVVSALQVALMLGLAVASYRWIETPLRKGNWFGKRWKTLVVGGGVLVTLSGGLVVLGKPLKGKLYTSDYEFERLITRARNYDERMGSYNGRNCNIEPGNRIGDISSLDNCYLQAAKQQHTFYFAGNSHTDHYRELHHKLNSENGLGVFSVSVSGCIFPCINVETQKYSD